MNMHARLETANLLHALTVAAAWGNLERAIVEAREAGLEDMLTRERCIERATELGDQAMAVRLAGRDWPDYATAEGRAKRLSEVCARIDDIEFFDNDEMTGPVQSVSGTASAFGLSLAPRLETRDSELVLQLKLIDGATRYPAAKADVVAFISGGEVSVSESSTGDQYRELRIALPQSARNRSIGGWELGIGLIDQPEQARLVLLLSQIPFAEANLAIPVSENADHQLFEMTALAASDGQQGTSVAFSPISQETAGWSLSCHPVAGSQACYLEFESLDESAEVFAGRRVTVHIDGLEPIELGLVDNTGFVDQRLDTFPDLSGKLRVEISDGKPMV